MVTIPTLEKAGGWFCMALRHTHSFSKTWMGDGFVDTHTHTDCSPLWQPVKSFCPAMSLSRPEPYDLVSFERTSRETKPKGWGQWNHFESQSQWVDKKGNILSGNRPDFPMIHIGFSCKFSQQNQSIDKAIQCHPFRPKQQSPTLRCLSGHRGIQKKNIKSPQGWATVG